MNKNDKNDNVQKPKNLGSESALLADIATSRLDHESCYSSCEKNGPCSGMHEVVPY
jgi:hypothetical protein